MLLTFALEEIDRQLLAKKDKTLQGFRKSLKNRHSVAGVTHPPGYPV